MMLDLPPGVEVFPRKDRASWLAMRLQDCSASDIGAVCGVSDRKTRARVWAEKTGLVGEIEDNAVLQRGRWYEAAVVEAMHETYPDWLIERGKFYLRHADLRIGGTPDAFVIDPDRAGYGYVECKAVASPIFADWDQTAAGDPICPLSFQLQALTCAKLAGATWAEVAVLVHTTYTAKLHRFEIPIHEGAWARVVATVANFWEDVFAGVQPPLDYGRDDDIVKALHPEEGFSREPLDWSADNRLVELAAKSLEMRGIISDLEKRQGAVDTEIRAKLGDHDWVNAGPWKITLKSQTTEAHWVKGWTSRVLRIRERKIEKAKAASYGGPF